MLPEDRMEDLKIQSLFSIDCWRESILIDEIIRHKLRKKNLKWTNVHKNKNETNYQRGQQTESQLPKNQATEIAEILTEWTRSRVWSNQT